MGIWDQGSHDVMVGRCCQAVICCSFQGEELVIVSFIPCAVIVCGSYSTVASGGEKKCVWGGAGLRGDALFFIGPGSSNIKEITKNWHLAKNQKPC